MRKTFLNVADVRPCVCAGVLQCVGGKDPSLPQSKRDSSYILLISAALQAQTF